MKKLALGLLLCLIFATGADIPSDRWHKGEGEFTFTGYAPLENKPVQVFYYIPKRDKIEDMRVLFVAHGATRAGKVNLNAWKEFAERDGFVVIAAQFSKEYYHENDYQFGGLYSGTNTEELQPQNLWTYNQIEALFDDFLKKTGSKAKTYDIWGHSAGGQFVHRFLLTMPHARVGRAVAANAGSWTFPIDGLEAASGKIYGWPFSIKNTPFGTRENLEKYFARDLTISLGTADIRTDTEDFPKHEAAMAEGGTRLERGHNFYNCAKKIALEMGLPFNWKVVEAEGIGHVTLGMVYGTSIMKDGKEIHSIDNYTATAGYGILFGTSQTVGSSPQKGHLVVIGGGTITDDIMERIVRYSGGTKNARILIVPYANTDTAYLARNVKRFSDYGCMNINWINCPPAELDRPENLAKLNGINVIFFSGGQQRDLANTLRGTQFLERIRQLHKAGVTIAGTSAGAAVMSKAMIAGGHRKVPKGENADTYGVITEGDVNLEEGFGFMPEVIIHQHFVVRKRLPSLFSALLDRPDMPGVGIDEATAIDVAPDGSFEVVGNSSVMVIEPKYKRGERPRFDVQILWKGDRYK